jgi:hypothetical protein
MGPIRAGAHVRVTCLGRGVRMYVIGLGTNVASEAFDAYMAVVDKQLTSLCVDLEALVREQFLPQPRMLLDTMKRPMLLIDTLHALEPHHFALLQHNAAKGRPPSALQKASIAYIALQSFTSQRDTPLNATKHISELKFEVITLVFFSSGFNYTVSMLA